MKQIVILFLVMGLSVSCSHTTEQLIDQAFPKPKTLQIGIKNNTLFPFLRTEVTTTAGTIVFQQIPANSYSEFYEIPELFSEAPIQVQMPDNYYSYEVLNYDVSTRVTEGIYYFEVSVKLPENTLLITRKSL
ncbi:hypothetical protein ACFSQP_06675 [Bizionia sediminis]|uniref:Uncharacterized protein n=1 Tax=Bizionia sediminis TaxID=1737064 RepID=A0ABW5KUU6_9FLAO